MKIKRGLLRSISFVNTNRLSNRLSNDSKRTLKNTKTSYYKPDKPQREPQKLVTETNEILYFRDVLNSWMKNNEVRLKGATKLRYRNLIDTHILPELGDVIISDITAPMINNFLNNKLENGRVDQQGGLSPSYTRSIMLIIHSALRFAADEQLCAPLKSSINKPVIPKKEISVLTREQQKTLEKELCCNPDSTKCGILITLYTGLRIGEVCALKWTDIDFECKAINIRHTITKEPSIDSERKSTLVVGSPKTAASLRKIPIPSNLMPFLIIMKNKSQSPFVISETESFVNPRTYDNRFRKILKNCGITHFNYHVLRHTFATRCIEAGVDMKTLSELLGHASVGITMDTYVHSSMDLKKEQIEKLSTYIS